MVGDDEIRPCSKVAGTSACGPTVAPKLVAYGGGSGGGGESSSESDSGSDYHDDSVDDSRGESGARSARRIRRRVDGTAGVHEIPGGGQCENEDTAAVAKDFAARSGGGGQDAAGNRIVGNLPEIVDQPPGIPDVPTRPAAASPSNGDKDSRGDDSELDAELAAFEAEMEEDVLASEAEAEAEAEANAGTDIVEGDALLADVSFAEAEDAREERTAVELSGKVAALRRRLESVGTGGKTGVKTKSKRKKKASKRSKLGGAGVGL
jgi:hypothetical protein